MPKLPSCINIVEDEAKSVEQSLKNGGNLLKQEAFDEWQRGAQGVWQDFATVVGGVERIKAVQSA